MTKETKEPKVTLAPNALKGTMTHRLLKSLKGQWFTLKYTKLSGESSELTGRLGVTKHLKGGKSTHRPEALVIWVPNRGYRTVYPENVSEVHYRGRVLRYSDDPKALHTTFGELKEVFS